MTRRVVPWTFIVSVVVCGVLFSNEALRAARPGNKVPKVLGPWDGFFVNADNSVDLVHSEITQQSGRRISGEGKLLDATTGHRITSYRFNGTLSANDIITATGKTPTGRFTLHSGIQFFPGHKGNAGVMDAQLGFEPKRGTESQFAAFLLSPFPDRHGPDLEGEGVGVCASQLDPSFAGTVTLQFLAGQKNAFPGSFTCVPQFGPIAPFSWQCRATVSDQGRFILIAQGKTGRMLIDGQVREASGIMAANADAGVVGTEATPSRFVDAVYSLQLHERPRDFGAMNFSLAPAIR